MPPRPSQGTVPRFVLLFVLCLLLSPLALPPAAYAQASDQAVYTDSPQNSWRDDYSWATINDANANPVHSGSDSISVTAAGYQALYFHHAAQDSTPYASLTFWINGGATGGQPLQVQATLNQNAQSPVQIGPLQANVWQKVTISLNALGVMNNPNFDGFWIQNTNGQSQPAYYVDDIALNAVAVSGSAVTVSVDASANRHAISPLVYGVCFGNATTLSGLNAPLNRSGGNNTSRYNWQLNASNHASDYFFESLADPSAVPGATMDDFISGTKSAGAQALMTIPMMDWIANLGPNRSHLDSFSVAKYGPQQKTDPYWSDAGNGVKTDGTNITGNDPADANAPNSTDFQTAWVQHLVGKWGTAANGGVRYYLLDNEPSLWFSTHRDVHPSGPTMDEIRDKMLAYSAAIKAVDPTALTVGPEEWGWLGYLYSGADQQYRGAHNYQGSPDKDAHGGMDYIPYLLSQIHQHDQTTGTRSLDVLSVHFYPQGDRQGHQESGSDTSAATQLLRNRSTRQLWDPNYTSENYINANVMLIPRLKNWVNAYDPGLQTAITEYNWGAESSINGATTQADIFGIFGREGLDMATRWTTPDPSTPTFKAMQMYRNYDGSKDGFGETSVSDTVPNPDNLSSFAAVRAADGALTVMVISKVLQGDTPVTVSLANFSAGASAQVWQLTSANAISRLAAVPVSGGSLTATVPAQSITLFVIPAAPVNRTVSGTVSLQWVASGQLAQTLAFTLTPTGSTAGSVTTQTVTPAADGSFTLTNVLPGTYTLGIKGSKWLRKDLPLDTTNGNVTGLSVSLLGGDATGDNKVNALDFLALRAAYGSAVGDGRYAPAADFNCDGKVNALDFLILRSNYGKAGDN